VKSRSVQKKKIHAAWANLRTFNVQGTNGLLTSTFFSAISMEYDTKNHHKTKTDIHFLMPFGPLKMLEGRQSFEYDYQDGYIVYNIVLAHAVLVPSVPSDSSGCYQEMSSFHDFSSSPVFFGL